MSQKTRILTLITIVTISISILTLFLLKNTILTKVSQFLIVETHKERHYDTAIVLSGGTGKRMDGMIGYHKKKPFQHIILTGNSAFNTSWPQIMKDYAKQKGIQDTPIELVRLRCAVGLIVYLF